jgi:hypothetical protein
VLKEELKMRNGRKTSNDVLVSRQLWAVAVACIFLLARDSQAQNSSVSGVKPQISVRISADHARLRPGEDIKLRVEIRNEGDRDLFIFKNIDNTFSNALATIDLTIHRGSRVFGPTMAAVADSFGSEHSTYPPLTSELPRYWIALAPRYSYSGEVVVKSSWFGYLRVPGKYRIEGKYSSRGFLVQDVNNPLAHYARELKELPYEAWIGSIETNSVWIEVVP